MADNLKPSTSTEKTAEKPQDKSKTSKPNKINTKKNADSNGSDAVIGILGEIQSEMRKQTGRMVEQEKRMQDQASEFQQIKNRLEAIENYDYNEQGDEYEYEEYEMDESGENSQSSSISKRKSFPDNVSTDENNNSRFKSMAKKFKTIEQCDNDIDSTLARNISELFQNGIDDERYDELVKSLATARPENCDGLVVVKMNQLIWDAVSTQAKGTDKKMQNIEASVIKAASVLSKVVDKMAKLEAEFENSPFSEMIDNCDDVLALMGHANRQINLARKDFLRPELNKEYLHLCSHHRPYTSQLFGDDVSKSARELEDCSKISSRMFLNRPFRGPVRRRQNRGSRGGYGRGNRGRGFNGQSSSEPKNFPRRGGSRPFKF